MTKFRMTMVVLTMLAGSTGCYYDQWAAADRALHTCQEKLTESQNNLLDCEHMNAQKDTQIKALQDQNDTQAKSLESLKAENEGLRSALAEAQGIAKEMASKQLGPVTIINRTLPPEVVNALRQLAKDHPEALEFDESTGAVRWKADLLFPLGSDQVSGSEQMQDALRRFAEVVNSPAAQNLDLVIVGHTDTTRIGKPETLKEHKTNWHLSAHRAIAVMRILGNLGVTENRMGVMGYGELRPIADNATTEGKARNRRVEIFLVQKNAVQSVSGTPGVYENDQAGAFVKPSETSGAAPARTPTARRTTPRPAGRSATRVPAAAPAAPPPATPPDEAPGPGTGQ